MILRILAMPFSILAYGWFVLALLIFHPLQVISFKLFGYHAHKKTVDILAWFLDKSLYFVFSKTKIIGIDKIPDNVPLIFVANHQSTYDIAGMSWHLHKYHPKYVSKIELAKNIPSVSFNLRNGGSVLIDRKDPKQALPLLKQLGEYINTNKRSAIIYPEGTRTKDGHPKEFAPNGVKILCKYAPDAFVVPVTINNSWKVFRYGKFPMSLGNSITFTVHDPVEVKSTDFNSLFEYTRNAIISKIEIPV
jgi:1-acyl-sn-glycerol-3-phosphate acyltransferase